MNKNVFLMCLMGLIVVIYIIDNFNLLSKTKSNENFFVLGNISKNISKNNSSKSKLKSASSKNDNSNEADTNDLNDLNDLNEADSNDLNDLNEINPELLDLLESQIESEIDQITGAEIKSESETETELIISSITNSGRTVLVISIIFIIIFIFCCSSCLMSIFTPSTPAYSYQPSQLYSYPPIPQNPYP